MWSSIFLLPVLASLAAAFKTPPLQNLFNGNSAIKALYSRDLLTSRSSIQYTTSLPNLTISMPVDHFNKSDTRTYQNRYWVNDTFYEPGGPVFFFDFGESGVTPHFINATLLEGVNTDSAVMFLAQKFKGVAVLWEHRFYGESQPIPIPNSLEGEISLPYKYLQYLKIEQALEDTVYFANHFQPPGLESHWTALAPSKTPWVFIGGSYPGARAAWARIRNPEVWYASWASSAVVEEMLDGSAYFDNIYNALLQYAPNCFKDLKAVTQYVQGILTNGSNAEQVDVYAKLVEAGAGGGENISEITSLPSINPIAIAGIMTQTITDEVEDEGFNMTLKNTCDFMEVYVPSAQKYHGDNLTLTVQSILENPDNATAPPQGLSASAGINATFEAYLLAIGKRDKQIIVESRGEPYNPYPITDIVGWMWQVCSEIGLFQVANTSNPENLILPASNVSSFELNHCKGLFNFPELPARANISVALQYGGWNMQPSNVYFSNGAMDPWRAFTVASTVPGSPMRNVTSKIPACGKAPAGTDVFGAVYPNSVHVSDLYKNRGEVWPSYTTGTTLLAAALEVWFKCFQAN